MKRQKCVALVKTVVAWLLAAIVLVPLCALVLASLKTKPEAATMNLAFPRELLFSNYLEAVGAWRSGPRLYQQRDDFVDLGGPGHRMLGHGRVRAGPASLPLQPGGLHLHVPGADRAAQLCGHYPRVPGRRPDEHLCGHHSSVRGAGHPVRGVRLHRLYGLHPAGIGRGRRGGRRKPRHHVLQNHLSAS